MYPCLDGRYEDKEKFDRSHVITKDLDDDRTNEESFCDFTVKADDQEFKVHKTVLGVLSPYFRKMFLSDMAEKRQNETNMDGINAEVMRVVIDYIYTGKFEADMDNIYDVVAAADYMQLALVQNRCSEYLIDQISVSNVVATWLCSVRYKIKTLQSLAEVFIVKSFSTLVEGDKFLDLDHSQIDQIILMNNKQSPGEVVCKCIAGWVDHDSTNRQKYFPQLFGHIDLRSISTRLLTDMVSTIEYVGGSLTCVRKVLDVCCVRSQVSPCHPVECIAAKGNYAKISKFNACEKNWIILSNRVRLTSRTIGRRNPGIFDFARIIVSNDKAYALTTSLDKIFILNLLENSAWSPHDISKDDNSAENKSFSCASFDGNICVAGGFKNENAIATAYRLRLDRKEWESMGNMGTGRAACALVPYGNKLYALGGFRENQVLLSSVEYFQDNTWHPSSPMLQGRHSFAAVVLYGQIYVIGGITDNEQTGTASSSSSSSSTATTSSSERYDPVTDHWCHVAPMTKPRSGHSACVHDGKIYVVDGEEVEVYDSLKYKGAFWKQQKSILFSHRK
ncbi:kelch repeat and BTB domain-containing protein 8-like [Clavelina lepadiformis]|uniref:kelch repeat and BTB domain-containing protein 8-like n=1 Tax=Clavelina lepadiformis TaxID=159417 RepID=UPI0040423FEF